MSRFYVINVEEDTEAMEAQDAAEQWEYKETVSRKTAERMAADAYKFGHSMGRTDRLIEPCKRPFQFHPANDVEIPDCPF